MTATGAVNITDPNVMLDLADLVAAMAKEVKRAKKAIRATLGHAGNGATLDLAVVTEDKAFMVRKGFVALWAHKDQQGLLARAMMVNLAHVAIQDSKDHKGNMVVMAHKECRVLKVVVVIKVVVGQMGHRAQKATVDQLDLKDNKGHQVSLAHRGLVDKQGFKVFRVQEDSMVTVDFKVRVVCKGIKEREESGVIEDTKE